MVVTDTDDNVDYCGNSTMEQAQENVVVRRRTLPMVIGDPRGETTLLSAGAQHTGLDVKVAAGSDDGFSECNEWALSIPESTHSFLFTEPVQSPAFWFGLIIAAVSIMTLLIVVVENYFSDWAAINVHWTVRISVYMGCFIILLMEEEIPTGLSLLKQVSRANLKLNCPQISYPKFVASCFIRIVIGVLFLCNALIVLVIADEVIVIFYDVLALVFIQQLDDIGFALCKKGMVLGAKMQRATMNPVFRKKFYKVEGTGWRSRIIKMFVKGLYIILFLICMGTVTTYFIWQHTGEFTARSITLSFGDEVWEKAYVKWPKGSAIHSRLKQRGRPTTEQKRLHFSFFNGVYKQDGREEGRPRYVEQKKSDRNPFDTGSSVLHPYHNTEWDPIEPAEIKFCRGRWIWTHKYIQMFENGNEGDCRWLARSPVTNEFDLLNYRQSIGLKWELWKGAIVETEVRISDNKCETDNESCNINGKCTNGKCVCHTDRSGVRYLGEHCEIQVEDQCKVIVSEVDNATWSEDWMGSNSKTEDLFSRPVYTYVKGSSVAKSRIDDELGESDNYVMMYSGSRWYGIILQKLLKVDDATQEFWRWQMSNWHPFWSDLTKFSTQVSEATTRDSPVGVDFFRIEDRPTFVNGEIVRYSVQDDQSGPFGSLIPMQKNMQTGRGLYRCIRPPMCSFCPGGVSDASIVVSGFNGANESCGSLIRKSIAEFASSMFCQRIQPEKSLCCQTG